MPKGDLYERLDLERSGTDIALQQGFVTGGTVLQQALYAKSAKKKAEEEGKKETLGIHQQAQRDAMARIKSRALKRDFKTLGSPFTIETEEGTQQIIQPTLTGEELGFKQADLPGEKVGTRGLRRSTKIVPQGNVQTLIDAETGEVIKQFPVGVKPSADPESDEWKQQNQALQRLLGFYSAFNPLIYQRQGLPFGVKASLQEVYKVIRGWDLTPEEAEDIFLGEEPEKIQAEFASIFGGGKKQEVETQADPRIEGLINTLMQAKAEPIDIRRAILAEGGNPELYGY